MTHNGDERTIGMILEKLENIERSFVTKQEFYPVKVLVYGFVSVVMVAVVSAMVYGVVANEAAKAEQISQEVIHR